MSHRGILKKHSNTLNAVLRFTDALMVFLAGWAAFFAYLHGKELHGQYWYPVTISVLLVTWIFPRFSLYEPWRGAGLAEEIRSLMLALGSVFLALAVLALVTKTGAMYSRFWTGLWFIFGLLTLIVSRVVLRLALHNLRERGYNLRTAVIVGGGQVAGEVLARIRNAAWTGIRVVGFFGNDSGRMGDLRRLGDLKSVGSYLEEESVDQVWIALPLREAERVRGLIHDLRHSTATIRYVPDIFGFRLLNHSVTEIAGLPVVDVSASPMEGPGRWIKAVEDHVLALLILVIISPLMLLIAIGVKLSSPGPVFYRQERVGWNGRPFTMLKFRSMPVDVEDQSGPVWASEKEKRATVFGAFLRRTSLDELPQFLNVLRGEMSIVGPRPERPIFVDKFKDEIPDYMKKHLVKAGITGWAQVNGWRGDTDLEKRIEYDLYYIENWSLWFDFKIIFLTLVKGFVHKNAY
jgi:putative colanic acid biosynthesis UDP-glucose lipid carrier transferase